MESITHFSCGGPEGLEDRWMLSMAADQARQDALEHAAAEYAADELDRLTGRCDLCTSWDVGTLRISGHEALCHDCLTQTMITHDTNAPAGALILDLVTESEVGEGMSLEEHLSRCHAVTAEIYDKACAEHRAELARRCTALAESIEKADAIGLDGHLWWRVFAKWLQDGAPTE